MKKTSFIILLVIEIFAGLISMGLLFSDVGALIYLIAALGFSIVLAPFFVCLRKATEETKKAKIRRNMLLIMLLPTIVAIIVVVAVVATMFVYFL